MPARDEHRRWSVTRLELQAWRNFSRQTEMHLEGRAFFIGPNASGKSNILDALNRRSRESRLKNIQEALRAAVPQFEKLELERDLTGDWHLYADYKHWCPKAARQTEATFSDGTLRLLGLLWALAEQGGPLLLEEPELSLHDALVSRLAGLMARMNRKTGRQVLVTTHSVALLRDPGIDLREIHLLEPGDEGTIVRKAAAMHDVAQLIEQGLSPGEAIMPRAAARDLHQLSLSF